MKTFIGWIVVAGIGIAAAALMVHFGLLSVAADEPHFAPVHRFLETVRTRSIAVRARDISVPNLDDPKLIAQGADHYAAMCAGCHLAPEVENSELRDGLYPRPPDLTKHLHPSPAETFWVIKHGIKMTGMPAWGKTHGDETIWGLVAFVRQLPKMTGEQYREMTARSQAKRALDAARNHGAPRSHVHAHEEP